MSILTAPAASLAHAADPRSFVRWGSRHGIPRVVIAAGSRSGDPYSRLCSDPALREDPYAFYDELRAAAPVVPGRIGAVTASYEVCAELVRSPLFLVGDRDSTWPRAARAVLAWSRDPAVRSVVDPPSLLVSNGPEHARLRRLVTKAFTPRAVDELGERVEQIVAELLDDLDRRQHRDVVVDVVAEFAALLPVFVIAEVLGVPTAMRETFLSWTRPIVPLTDRGTGYLTFCRAEECVRRLNAWFLEHLARLRRNLGRDLLSDIIRQADEDVESGGPGLSETELMVTAGLLLGAASETTVNLIGNAIVVLLGHPDQLADLMAQPAGWPNAIDEVLRFDPPSHITYRHPAQDTTVRGVTIRRGQLIMPIFAGANRDPEVFTDPGTFDITRANASQHMSFSAGAHYCFGAPLARLEARVALRRFFERFPGAALAEQARRRPTRAMRGYAKIPMRLRATRG